MGSDLVEEAEALGEGVADGEFSGAEVPELDAGGVVVALDPAIELGPAMCAIVLARVVHCAWLCGTKCFVCRVTANNGQSSAKATGTE